MRDRVTDDFANLRGPIFEVGHFIRKVVRGSWINRILHFLTPRKNYGRGGRDFWVDWSFTYNRTCEIHLMAVLCAAANRSGLIKKKKEKKESSAASDDLMKHLRRLIKTLLVKIEVSPWYLLVNVKYVYCSF